MKRRMYLTMAALAVVFGITALAADVTGKWAGQVPGRNGATAATFTFKVTGDQLTGTMTGPQGNDLQLKDGKVSGNDISFKTTLEFNGNSIVLLFTGTANGDEIKMKRQREGGQAPAQDFTLKRAN